ncbi:glycosyltransferase family 4 protein [Mariniblastus fucicola]|uniref:Glycogen synthase n=1 Tax=Mariniblastus fucicola TaxID=980251 RepID=A0A5B9PB80_9BACT|nr:glycosyltransferase family 4 protein [Mariniblastus fucicola]QEG23544.1 Glycogen synthase [Mariniblastus fucicola]
MSTSAFEDRSSTSATAISDGGSKQVLDVHAVVLTNYLRTHHVLALQEFSKRVRKLTVLLSVPMEPDRDWDAQWGGLDVQVQQNFMWTANWKHSTGFSEQNFIHFPIDTPIRLRKLKPDIVLSYEMGARTILSTFYRLFKRNVPLVMVGNMSDHIEKERGFLRRIARKLICRGVDYFTYNGPSCKRYLKSLGVSEDKLFHFPYCIDGSTIFNGDRLSITDGKQSQDPIKLLYCGAISERKGILQFAEALSQWCGDNPYKSVELMIAGSGELKDKVAQTADENLDINFLGNCDSDQLREAYGSADICVFPTLADEWGLVPIEAMASGVPVLGSKFAQSVESCCVDSENGWTFDPTNSDDIVDAIDRALTTDAARLQEMRSSAKRSVAHISPERSGCLLAEAVASIKSQRVPNDISALQRQTT